VSAYLARRLIATAVTLAVLMTLVFSLIHLMPGDVVDLAIGSNYATEEQIRSLRARYGLDRPLRVQFLDWLGGLAVGDLGVSFRTGQPVGRLVWNSLGVTIELAVLAEAFALAIGVSLGVLSAGWRGRAVDVAVRLLGLVGLSVPLFLQGVLLLLVLSLYFHWIPPAYTGLTEDPWANAQTMILPAFTLGVALAAILMRLTRAELLDVLAEQYVTTARAKGLAERTVVLVHALRNAAIPILTATGLQVGYLLGGVVIVEQVFTLPGLGRLLMQAILQRDYPLIQGCVLVIATLFILTNLAVDVAYSWLNPRIKRG
jgi:peptide/nickel transport system permease protein